MPIAVVTMLTVAAAAAVTLVQTPQYKATTELFVSAGGEDLGQAFQGGVFVQQRVRSYIQVVDSPEVLGPVIDDLGLELSTRQLAGTIEAGTPFDTVLLTLTATSANPDDAAAIANAVAAEFRTYIETLESRVGQVTAPVKVSVVKPAEPPGAPSSPSPVTNLALGLIGGIGLGIAAAVLRDALDSSIRTTDDAEAVAQAPLLANIPYDSDASRPLGSRQGKARSHREEAIRRLRTNLQYVDVDHPVRIVVVTSSMPGEGKTTTALDLSIAVARNGQRVLLLEGDLRRPRAVEVLGLVEGVGLTDVLVGDATFAEVVQTVPNQGVDVLACGPVPPNPAELLGSQQMEKLLLEQRDHYDLVVIDAPPLLAVTDAAVLARASDGTVLVVRSGRTKREEVRAAKAALDAVSARLLGVVLTMGQSTSPAYASHYSPRRPPKKRRKAATAQRASA